MTWTVPGYVATQLIGRGASAEVWRGRSDAGEVVALKRLLVADAHAQRGAQAEAALLAALEHPHILRLRELLVSEGEAILVTDFAAGGSLAEVLEHRGRLSPGEVVTIVAPIAAALAHAHAEGVVHGDISASNILFTGTGLPLLADLGVARIVGQVDGGTRATADYVDPLVARGHAPGPHSDVFALAAVCWHALTGTAPWTGESVAESLARAAEGALPPIASIAGTVPSGLAAALDRALQDDAHLRGSAAELALDSRHAVQPVPVDGWTARPTAAQRGRHCAPDPAPVPASASASRGETSGAPARPSGPADHPIARDAGRPPFRRAEPPPLVSASARTRSARAASPVTADGAPPSRLSGSGERGVLAPAGVRRRWGTAVLAAAAMLASVAVGAWWAQRDAQVARNGPAVQPLAHTSAGVPTGPAEAAPVAVDWSAELARADAARARAYLTGDPALLGEVYSSGRLLDADRAQLVRQVPAGCSLDGASTQYSALQVQDASPASARLGVTAMLPSARLSCAGEVRAVTDQVGPVQLAVTLARGADGIWRIEDQRIAG